MEQLEDSQMLQRPILINYGPVLEGVDRSEKTVDDDVEDKERTREARDVV